jgi:hypothetical protein
MISSAIVGSIRAGSGKQCVQLEGPVKCGCARKEVPPYVSRSLPNFISGRQLDYDDHSGSTPSV